MSFTHDILGALSPHTRARLQAHPSWMQALESTSPVLPWAGALHELVARLEALPTLPQEPWCLEDLLLAAACAQGDAAALSLLEDTHGPMLEILAARFASKQHDADDLLQILRSKLFVPLPTQTPRILEYSGRGTLGAWLRVTAVRTFIDAHRTDAQHKRETPHQDLAADLPDSANPELALLRHAQSAAFQDAFAHAIASLESSQRNLLRQHFLQGLTHEAIASLYGVHRSSVGRWLEKTHQDLLRATKRRLTDLDVPRDELDSLLRLLQSQWDVSLSRLLQSTLS